MKKNLRLIIGMVVVIVFLLLPWVMMMQTDIKINKSMDNYEIVEAEILDINRGRGDIATATISYVYNGEFCQTNVCYYDREDQGKNLIQIAIDKETGKVNRTGIHFSYGDISKILVIICLVLLIFAKIYDDKKINANQQ